MRSNEASNRELKHATFLMDDNRKCAVFVFNFSSHYHINVVKSLFTCRYDQFENLRETTVLACEMLTSGVRPWLKNVACLKRPNIRWCDIDFKYTYFYLLIPRSKTDQYGSGSTRVVARSGSEELL